MLKENSEKRLDIQVKIGNQIDEQFSQGFIDISEVRNIADAKIVRFDAMGYQILDEIKKGYTE